MVSACYMLFSHWLQVKILKWIHKEATWKLWKVNNSRQIGVESQILKNELQVPSRLFWSSLLFRSQLWLKGSQMPEMLAGANRKNSERNNLFLSFYPEVWGGKGLCETPVQGREELLVFLMSFSQQLSRTQGAQITLVLCQRWWQCSCADTYVLSLWQEKLGNGILCSAEYGRKSRLSFPPTFLLLLPPEREISHMNVHNCVRG